MQVKVLVENTEYNEYKGEHGLSLLVTYKGKDYLIDTGASGLFSENAETMGVDLSRVECAFLSHAHYDHSGGYPEFFEKNKTAKVYLQRCAQFNCYYKILDAVKKYVGIPKGVLEQYEDRFEYVDGYKEIAEGITILPHSTKNLSDRGKRAHMYCQRDGKVVVDDFAHEQTVLFDTEKGLVAFNSCSHGGVENIVEEIKQAFPEKKIYAFFGGFHMMGLLGTKTSSFKQEEVIAVAEQLKESSDACFYSGHCTGTLALEWLKSVLGDRLQAIHSGLKLEI